MLSSSDQEPNPTGSRNRRWQFSLRGLFIATTLIAAAMAFAVEFPVIAVLCALFAVPLLLQIALERCMAHVSVRAPSVARVFFAVVGIGFIVLGAYSWALVNRNAPPDHLSSQWLPLVFFGGFGVLCCYAAFTVPDKPPDRPTDPPGAAN